MFTKGLTRVLKEVEDEGEVKLWLWGSGSSSNSNKAYLSYTYRTFRKWTSFTLLHGCVLLAHSLKKFGLVSTKPNLLTASIFGKITQ